MSIAKIAPLSKTIENDKAWLSDMIRRGEKGPFAEIVQLTPALAEMLLSSNPENRPKKTWRIQEMAEDIKAGRWELNGQTVVVSKCGLLNDGQNRCTAVLEADKPITTFMVFGIDREARKRMDIGSARTVGDFLGMESISNSNNVAAAGNYILKICRWGKVTTGMDQKPPKTEITDFSREIAPELAFGFRVCNRAGHSKIAPLSLLVTAHYLMSQVHQSDADIFMNDLIRGTGLAEGDPVFVARDKLMDSTKRLNHNEKLKTLFSAWNNRRAGRKVRTLQHSMKRHEKLPELK